MGTRAANDIVAALKDGVCVARGISAGFSAASFLSMATVSPAAGEVLWTSNLLHAGRPTVQTAPTLQTAAGLTMAGLHLPCACHGPRPSALLDLEHARKCGHQGTTIVMPIPEPSGLGATAQPSTAGVLLMGVRGSTDFDDRALTNLHALATALSQHLLQLSDAAAQRLQRQQHFTSPTASQHSAPPQHAMHIKLATSPAARVFFTAAFLSTEHNMIIGSLTSHADGFWYVVLGHRSRNVQIAVGRAGSGAKTHFGKLTVAQVDGLIEESFPEPGSLRSLFIADAAEQVSAEGRAAQRRPRIACQGEGLDAVPLGKEPIERVLPRGMAGKGAAVDGAVWQAVRSTLGVLTIASPPPSAFAAQPGPSADDPSPSTSYGSGLQEQELLSAAGRGRSAWPINPVTLRFPRHTEQQFGLWHAQQLLKVDTYAAYSILAIVLGVGLLPPMQIAFDWPGCYVGLVLVVNMAFIARRFILGEPRYIKNREAIMQVAFAALTAYCAFVAIPLVIPRVPAVLLQSWLWRSRLLFVEALFTFALLYMVRFYKFIPAQLLNWGIVEANSPVLCRQMNAVTGWPEASCRRQASIMRLVMAVILPAIILYVCELQSRRVFAARLSSATAKSKVQQQAHKGRGLDWTEVGTVYKAADCCHNSC